MGDKLKVARSQIYSLGPRSRVREKGEKKKNWYSGGWFALYHLVFYLFSLIAEPGLRLANLAL